MAWFKLPFGSGIGHDYPGGKKHTEQSFNLHQAFYSLHEEAGKRIGGAFAFYCNGDIDSDELKTRLDNISFVVKQAEAIALGVWDE